MVTPEGKEDTSKQDDKQDHTGDNNYPRRKVPFRPFAFPRNDAFRSSSEGLILLGLDNSCCHHTLHFGLVCRSSA